MYVVDQSNFDFSSHELCQGVNMAWQYTLLTSERSRLSPTSKNFGKYYKNSSFRHIILNQGNPQPRHERLGSRKTSSIARDTTDPDYSISCKWDHQVAQLWEGLKNWEKSDHFLPVYFVEPFPLM